MSSLQNQENLPGVFIPITSRIESIYKNEFAKVALNANSEIFVLYMSPLELIKGVYPSRIYQIAALQWDKASTKVSAKYADYVDIFLFNLAIEFF